MKDIPVFDTEYGVASLFLQEVSYRGRAHIKLQATQEPEKLLEECVAFCRACGAEWCDAAGHAYLEQYPCLATLVLMQADRAALQENRAKLVPLTAATQEHWRALYNERMKNVPNCAYLDERGARELREKGGCYFIYEADRLLGIGGIDAQRIETVAAAVPGAGERIVRALATVMQTPQVQLVVALENERAVALYQRLGFVQIRLLSRWYRVL